MGLRREKVSEIEKLTDTQQHSLKQPVLSAQTIHRLYQTLIGKEPQPFKGQAWHIRQIMEETSIVCHTDFYADQSKIPVKELGEIITLLKEKQHK